MKIRVYRNLHRRCYSIKGFDSTDKTTYNRVIAYQDRVILKDCRFIVQAWGRNYTLQTQQKNIHAFVQGEQISEQEFDRELLSKIWTPFTYNPYYADHFYCLGNERPIYQAKYVDLNQTKTSALIQL